MAAHARLGPSNARWPECPGSVREEAQYEDTSGAAAIDGTLTHLLVEICINDLKADEARVARVQVCLDYIGMTLTDDEGNTCVVDEARAARVQVCLDYVAKRMIELQAMFPGATITVESEQKTHPGGYFGRDDWWGTVDITIIVTQEGHCHYVEAIDYKDGQSWVKVDGNTQLYSYVGGQMRQWIGSGPSLVRPFKHCAVGSCRITIVQPKTSKPIRFEDLTPVTVMQKLEQLSIAAYATDDPNAPLKSGKHCAWCKANPKRGGHCTAAKTEALNTMSENTDITVADNKQLFEQLSNVIDPSTMTSEKLAEIADAHAGIDAIFKSVEDEIQKRIDAGKPVNGYAMKPGKKSRDWNEDAKSIEKMLKGRKLKLGDIYPAKIISVAQLLKSDKLTQQQKDRIEKDYVTEKDGKMKLTKVARNKSLFDEIPVAQVEELVVQSEPAKKVTSFL